MKQIKNLVYTLLLSVLGATMFTACSEEEGVVDAKDLVLSKEEVVFLAEPGESQSVTFTANADWKATSEQGWILIDTPVGKKGESTVSVSVKENIEKVSRQGNVIITEPSTGKMASFKVKQEAQGVNFVVDKEIGELYIDNENKVISERISVAANFKYDIQIKGAEWVTYSIDESTKDIIFHADNEKATIEPKDITVEFVPVDEENVETQSWILKWNGFTPSLEFFKDKECTQPVDQNGIELEITMNGIQATVYTKSNVPWVMDTDIEGSILKKVNYKEETDKFPRIFDTTSSLFAVYDDDKISKNDKEIILNCKYENSQEKSIKIVKKGVENFTQIGDSVFDFLKGDDLVGDYFCPMFPASGEKLSLEFPVRSLNDNEDLDVVLMSYDYKTQTCTPIYGESKIDCSYTKDSTFVGEVRIMKYTLTLPDRSKVEGEDGDDRYFQMFIKPRSLSPGDFYNNYFVFDGLGMRFDETKRNEIGNVIFGQLAYFDEFDFKAVNWTDGQEFSISDSGEDVVEIKFTTEASLEEEMFISDNAICSEDNKFILSGDDFWGNDIWTFDFALEIDNEGKETGVIIFKFSAKKNTTSEIRPITITLGGKLGEDKIQYFGSFTIKQAAASSALE